MRFLVACLVLCLPLLLVCGANAATVAGNLLPNPSFESGQDAPTGWAPFAIGGSAWEREGADDSRSVSITGLGDDVSWWAPLVQPELQANRVYRLSYWLKRDARSVGGTPIAGLDWVSRDTPADVRWSERAFCFRTPDVPMRKTLFRLGERRVKGKVYFDKVTLAPALPVYNHPGTGVELGRGERIAGGQYDASHPLGRDGSTDFRCLDRFSARFNSDCWVFERASQVIYRHAIGRMRQTDAEIEIGVTNLVSGVLVVEAGPDGKQWVKVGEIGKPGGIAFPVPSNLVPAREMWVRLRSGEGADLQLGSYAYRCRLPEADSSLSLVGATHYLSVERASRDLTVDVQSVGDLRPGSANNAELRITNAGRLRRSVVVSAWLTRAGQAESGTETTVSLPPGRPRRVVVPYDLRSTGPHILTLRCADSASEAVLWEGTTSFDVAPSYDASGGQPTGHPRPPTQSRPSHTPGATR